jgi:fatty acid desaturase
MYFLTSVIFSMMHVQHRYYGVRLMLPAKFKNMIAIAYVFVSYILGITLILQYSWLLNIWGVIAIAHSLVISTALIHELIHGNIFKSRQLNVFWGEAMTHLNGACYAPWANLVEHHFNHHLHYVDVVRYEVTHYLNQDVNFIQRSIYIALEWLYFPVLEFELRWRIILDPFMDRQKRSLVGRTIFWAVLRTVGFGILAWMSWKALLLYFLAYTSFVNVNRFVDAFQHTYEYSIVGEDFPQLDRTYEQKNTFSNLLSFKYPWLNLLVLNFGYHNAHHHNMNCPWHELPSLHDKLYGKLKHNLLPLLPLIGNYHRFRLRRLFSGQGEIDAEKGLSLNSFIGGVTVSMLTPP